MKQKFRSIVALALVATTIVACKDDNNDDDAVNTALQTANEMFVNQTVIPTYKGLADECAKMQDAIAKLDGVKSVSVNFMTQKLTLEADDDKFDDILKKTIKTIAKVEPDCRVLV